MAEAHGSSAIYSGTVTPQVGFSPEADCKALRKAMEGLGTNEKALINIICYRSSKQRQELKLQYKSMYGKDLVDHIKSELSGDFEKVMVALMMSQAEYDAHLVREAVKGLGTDEDLLIEVLCTRSNAELEAAKEVYKKAYKNTLEKDVASDTSGDFKKILVSLITARRDTDDVVDPAQAKKDAKALYDAGEGRWGTNESVFNSIFATRSFPHLRHVFDEYDKLSKKSIEKAIESEMSGDFKRAMLTIVQSACSRPAFFAEKLYKSMKGLGTDEAAVIRVMVSRSEIDLTQIKDAFQKEYGKSLLGFIKGDTSGDFERALVALCRT